MGDIFEGLNGGFNGYALEDSDFDTQSDDSDVNEFFNDDTGEGVLNKKAIKKSKKIFKRTSDSGAFGGF